MIMLKKFMQPLNQAWVKTVILEKKPWWSKTTRPFFPEIHLVKNSYFPLPQNVTLWKWDHTRITNWAG